MSYSNVFLSPEAKPPICLGTFLKPYKKTTCENLADQRGLYIMILLQSCCNTFLYQSLSHSPTRILGLNPLNIT